MNPLAWRGVGLKMYHEGQKQWTIPSTHGRGFWERCEPGEQRPAEDCGWTREGDGLGEVGVARETGLRSVVGLIVEEWSNSVDQAGRLVFG